MSINLAISELERAYEELLPIFPKPMSLPVITIQTRGRSRRLGWFCADKWNDQLEGRRKAEINIAAESLGQGSLEIVHTLVHEMVHFSNNQDGIRDCTVNQYHNKKFAERCQVVGLVPRYGHRGWSDTEISEGLLEQIKALELDDEAFTLFRNSPEVKKAPTKLLKWTCGCTNVRVATDFAAHCDRCGGAFQRR